LERGEDQGDQKQPKIRTQYFSFTKNRLPQK